MPVLPNRGAVSATPAHEGVRPAARRRRGTSAVEFALVAPAIFFFVLGIVELGRGFMVTHLLNNAARQGCRAGVIPATSTADIKALVTSKLEAQGVRGTTTTVLVNDNDDTDASQAKSADEITVRVSIPVGDFTWLPGGQLLSGSLGARYTLRRE
jgi:Flp pilus assembly protein TadG